MDSSDLPSTPEGSGRPEEARAGGDLPRSGPRSRELPDPDERGRVYEATRAHAEAQAAIPLEQVPEPGQSKDGIGQRSYWTEVPRLGRMWSDHDGRWPAHRQPAAAVDRSADPAGSHRSDGGFYLSPERHAETADAIGRVRQAEPPISADTQTAERENISGGCLEGFNFRLKGDDRLKEKVAEQLKAEPEKTSGEVLQKIPDAIRYTFCFQPESYVSGYYDIKARLESCGHEMYLSKNSWGNLEYKGINTRWMTQEGQRFEVQFHTPESFHAKHRITHGGLSETLQCRLSWISIQLFVKF
ncbi:MAG: hypothetical protein M3Z75_06050 [Actinomycetota bacterium]|nr:hypothetical protein [Actinomycetota bacterium]